MVRHDSLTNVTNTSTNATYRVLSFLEAQLEEWSPSQIAKELRISAGTVRWVLKQLKANGKVFYIPRGKVHFYAATRQFTDDFNRMFKAYPTNKLYEIHGLSLKLEGDFANIMPEGGRGVVREGFDYYGGRTSFQLSVKTMMIWGSFTSRPLDWDRFLLWLSVVDGFCKARGWVGIEGYIEKWVIVQFGLNRDWKRFRNDSPTRCVSLQGFKNWFARVYQKEELGVLREEIHSRDERSLEQFVHLVDGSMTSVQVMNFLELVVRTTNESHAINADMVKRLCSLADIVQGLVDEVRRLKVG